MVNTKKTDIQYKDENGNLWDVGEGAISTISAVNSNDSDDNIYSFSLGWSESAYDGDYLWDNEFSKKQEIVVFETSLSHKRCIRFGWNL